jgi:D-alanyl-lipoteichoic acid acyltransferase DltB (MBOAT superfamily)
LSLIKFTNFLNVLFFGIVFEIFIYFNFAGLSLIIYSIFGLLGVEIPLNFRQPFSSRNIIEFWRGWHISLSIVLKELFYNPVKEKSKGYIATIVVFVGSALWHAVTLNFLIWGIFHALAFNFSKILYKKRSSKIVLCIIMIITIIFGRIIFSETNFSNLLLKLSFSNFSKFEFPPISQFGYLSFISLVIGLILILLEFIFYKKNLFKQKTYKFLRVPISQIIMLIIVILLIQNSSGINYAAYNQR